ncbi:hypothetical protein XELAEV_18001675mg [Xenopus laevis]|uniref:Uncharacterized protein n=1 Tax=Xenopus laevis TaxID=8355 RepID=A0A974BNY7_XENLA|nr:hypothetical protein XELAEV_18001675mg [Xenopus laevis]
MFIWGNKQARISLKTLTAPKTLGGLACLHFLLYYLAAQLVYVAWSLNPSAEHAAFPILAEAAGSVEALTNTILRGTTHRGCPPSTLKMLPSIWETALRYDKTRQIDVSPYTPIWCNPKLRHFLTIPDPALWARYNIKYIGQLYENQGFKSYEDLATEFNLPRNMWYRYFQDMQHFANFRPPSSCPSPC